MKVDERDYLQFMAVLAILKLPANAKTCPIILLEGLVTMKKK